MKKVILSIVFVFTVTTFVNATILVELDCVEEAVEAGDAAEESGYTYEEAYIIALNEYSKCIGGPVQ
ncbi:hypothetical protein [Lutibacter sp.]